jgi:hypothetical protein
MRDSFEGRALSSIGCARSKPTGLLRSRHGPKKIESENHRYMKPSYLPEMRDLAWCTGRRRDAIRTLRYSDLVRQGGEVVAIRRRATNHAEQTAEAPLAAAAREAVKRILAQRPGVGDAPLFPSFARNRSTRPRARGGCGKRRSSRRSSTRRAGLAPAPSLLELVTPAFAGGGPDARGRLEDRTRAPGIARAGR